MNKLYELYPKRKTSECDGPSIQDILTDEIQSQLPKNLQGYHGVVRTLDDVKERNLRNKTENNRWFLDTPEILTSADGVQFVVSTEWATSSLCSKNTSLTLSAGFSKN